MRLYLLLFGAGFVLGAGAAGYVFLTREAPVAVAAVTLLALVVACAAGWWLFVRGRDLYDRLWRILGRTLRRPLAAARRAGAHLQAGVRSPWFAAPAAGFSLAEVYGRLGGGQAAYARMRDAGLLPEGVGADPDQLAGLVAELEQDPSRLATAMAVLGDEALNEAMAVGDAAVTDGVMGDAAVAGAEGGWPDGREGPSRAEARETQDLLVRLTVLVGFVTCLVRQAGRLRRGELSAATAGRFLFIDTAASALGGLSWWSGTKLAMVLLPTASGWVPGVLAGGITTMLTAPLIGQAAARLKNREYERAVGALTASFAELGEAAARADRLTRLTRRTERLIQGATEAVEQARAYERSLRSWQQALRPTARYVLAREHALHLQEQVLEARRQATALAARLEELARTGDHQALGEIVYLNQATLLDDDADLGTQCHRVDEALHRLEHLRPHQLPGGPEPPAGRSVLMDQIGGNLREIGDRLHELGRSVGDALRERIRPGGPTPA